MAVLSAMARCAISRFAEFSIARGVCEVGREIYPIYASELSKVSAAYFRPEMIRGTHLVLGGVFSLGQDPHPRKLTQLLAVNFRFGVASSALSRPDFGQQIQNLYVQPNEGYHQPKCREPRHVNG